MTLTLDHQASIPPSPFVGVTKRAVIVALVLGSVLASINQSEAIFGGQDIQYLPMALGFITPFLVVNISQILGIRKALTDASKLGSLAENPLQTALRHGIPIRAVVLGLFAGSLNAIIVGVLVYLNDGSLSNLPIATLAQAYSLPMIFGVLSQTISYRRTMAARA